MCHERYSSASGSVSFPRTFWHAEKQRIKPATLRLVDRPLCHLSHSCPLSSHDSAASSRRHQVWTSEAHAPSGDSFPATARPVGEQRSVTNTIVYLILSCRIMVCLIPCFVIHIVARFVLCNGPSHIIFSLCNTVLTSHTHC